MRKKSHQRKFQIGRRVFLSAIFALALSFVLAQVVFVAEMQNASTTASPKPNFEEKEDSVIVEGYTLTPGNVSTVNWPTSIAVNFSLERSDKQNFRTMSAGDIEAEMNGQSISLKSNALSKGGNSEPIKVLFMIDRSGSMVTAKSSSGINKLEAAQDSLRTFIENLDASDQAMIAAFDETQEVIVPLTNNRSDLYSGITNIKASTARYTYVYDAIEYAVDKAKQNNIDKVIVLSDGFEDIAEIRPDDSTYEDYKSQKEDRISRIAREKGIRIFSIAIGAMGDRRTLGNSFVDYDSLKRISDETNGGTATPVDLPDLNYRAGGDRATLKTLLKDKLDSVLVDMKKSFRFAYALNVDMPPDVKEGSGELKLNFKLKEGSKDLKIPLAYSYTWDKESGPPTFKRGKVLSPIFIDTTLPTIDWFGLTQIYILLLSPLALLGVIPLLMSRIAATREMNKMSRAIVTVGRGSSLIGQQCPNETGPWGARYAFKEGDSVVVCPQCSTAHHLSCWDFNQHQCMNRNCEYQFLIPSRVLSRYGIASETNSQPV